MGFSGVGKASITRPLAAARIFRHRLRTVFRVGKIRLSRVLTPQVARHRIEAVPARGGLRAKGRGSAILKFNVDTPARTVSQERQAVDERNRANHHAGHQGTPRARQVDQATKLHLPVNERAGPRTTP
jgi:hypothetical protein